MEFFFVFFLNEALPVLYGKYELQIDLRKCVGYEDKFYLKIIFNHKHGAPTEPKPYYLIFSINTMLLTEPQYKNRNDDNINTPQGNVIKQDILPHRGIPDFYRGRLCL
jgi:hypothetical protein